MLIACPVPVKQKAADLCAAFIEGAPRSATGYVFYGVTEENLPMYRKAKASGQSVYMIDNSAFDKVRGIQYRVSKDRYHHNGIGTSNGQRFADLGIEVQPWQQRSFRRSMIMAVEQSPSYMACVAGDRDWLVREMTLLSQRDTILLRAWNRDKRKAMQTLAQDMDSAFMVLTHSSAAAVEALLAGVRVYVSPMSPCYSILSRQQELRQGLFNVLADNQFSVAEMRDGTAWKALNP